MKIRHIIRGTTDKICQKYLCIGNRHDFVGWMLVKATQDEKLPENLPDAVKNITEGSTTPTVEQFNHLSHYYGTSDEVMRRVLRSVMGAFDDMQWQKEDLWPELTEKVINPILSEVGVKFEVKHKKLEIVEPPPQEVEALP